MPVISHRAPAERSHITLIYMCVTFMSFTMAWNNPPSAPHSFSTDSMVSNNQTKQKKLAERLSGKTKSDQISASLRIRRGELWGFLFCSSALPRPLFPPKKSSGDDGKPLSSPAACAPHRQKETLLPARWHREGSRRSWLLAPGWMEQRGPG